MHVVLIDSGIDPIYLNTIHVNIVNRRNIIDESVDIDDHLGHGTAVASIILKMNANVDLSIIKIYDYEFRQQEYMLLRALEFIKTAQISKSVIHMSLGIRYDDEILHKLCCDICKNDNVIVSAFDNSGAVSFPAAYDEVIGVEANDLCTKVTDFIFLQNSIVDVQGKGGMHRIAVNGYKHAIKQGNSMSAAYVTGCISKLQIEHFTKSEAISQLRKLSTFQFVSDQLGLDSNFSSTLDTNELQDIKNIAIYPYNKETSNLVKFSHMLPFNIVDIYSSRYLGNVGRVVYNISGNSYQIKNITNLDMTKVDMLVIGHTRLIESISGEKIKKYLLEQCIKNHVNVYAFDIYDLPLYKENFKNAGLFLSSPSNGNANNSKNIYGKLFSVKSPVIGIFGTSSKQGKFVVQLLLRQCLINRGYSVAQLSSEPTGPIFGFDETISFGYDSNMNLDDREFISQVNSSMHRLDMKSRDIIIVGCQSRTIPISYKNIGHLALRQMQFLIATQPDAIVLCINYDDDIEYIKRTISIILES